MKIWLLYHNDAGTGMYEIDWENVDIHDFLVNLIEECGDDPMYIEAFEVRMMSNGKMDAERIYPPDDYEPTDSVDSLRRFYDEDE